LKNNIFKLIVICLISYNFQTFSNSNTNLPSPYSDLQEVLPFNGHGWYSNPLWIELLMRINNVKTVVEVGSWLGLSTRHIASLLQPGGKIYAIDTWEGSVEHHENTQYAVMLPTLYDQFLSNIIHAQLTDKVVPIRKHSLQAATVLLSEIKQADLVYIDAAHDTDSVLKDLQAYWPFVANNGGVLCGDDWWHDPVKAAVRAFAQMNQMTIYADDNFWFVKKENQYSEKSFKYHPLFVWKFDIR
jgi:predicted O-methyltransferase YrrM